MCVCVFVRDAAALSHCLLICLSAHQPVVRWPRLRNTDKCFLLFFFFSSISVFGGLAAAYVTTRCRSAVSLSFVSTGLRLRLKM